MRFLILWTMLTLPGPAAAAASDNWPSWRGPDNTGFAPDANPPLRWDEKTNIQWKAALPGKGSSTPIVWENRVFVLTAVETGKKARLEDRHKPDPNKKTEPPDTYYQFLVLCFDRQTGKELWRRVAAEQVPHEGHHQTHSYAAASPCTDGKRLIAPFGSRGIYCYDLDGKLLWQRDLGRLHTRLGWGEGASPTLHGDTLVVNWDQEAGSRVYALDAATGKTMWHKDRDEQTSWGTPLVIEHGGRVQAILNATNRVRSYDLKTGELLWQCGGQTVNVIPSPLRFGDQAICMSGYRGAFAASIPLDARGDLTDSERLLWRYDKGTPYVPSPVLAGERLFFTQANTGILTCLDVKTGKVLIAGARVPGLSSLYASPTATRERVYFVARDGTAVVIKNADRLEVLASNRLEDTIDASPVLVGRQLFLRGEKTLYCISESER